MRMGTWDFQPQTKKMIWSNECRNIYGFPLDYPLKSTDVIEYNHPDDKEYIAAAVQKALDPDNTENLRIKHRIIRFNDQQVRWIRVHGKVFFVDRKPARFIGTMLDITEEKKAVQQIRENEQRLRMAIQSTRLGTWEFHPLTRELSWSDESRKIYNKHV